MPACPNRPDAHVPPSSSQKIASHRCSSPLFGCEMGPGVRDLATATSGGGRAGVGPGPRGLHTHDLSPHAGLCFSPAGVWLQLALRLAPSVQALTSRFLHPAPRVQPPVSSPLHPAPTSRPLCPAPCNQAPASGPCIQAPISRLPRPGPCVQAPMSSPPFPAPVSSPPCPAPHPAPVPRFLRSGPCPP